MKNGTRSYEVNQNNEALFTEKLFRELLLDLKSFLKERTFGKHYLQDLFGKPIFTSLLRRSKTVFKFLAVAHIVNKLRDDFVTAFNGEEALEEASRREKPRGSSTWYLRRATCPEASSEDLQI